MGETDTKPVEGVSRALSFSGDKDDQKKNQPRKSKHDYEKEIENMSKELSNCKTELEAKKNAHMQALLKLEQNQKMTCELSTLMKKSDSERNKYMKECMEGRARIHELESKIKHMTKQHQHQQNDEHITISLKEYKSLVRDTNKKQNKEVVVESKSELAWLRNELECAKLRIEELRVKAEEALKRAELAEKGKNALEEKFKRQKEHRHRKRAALAALREVSTPENFCPSTSYGGTPKICQPLGKVLNLKL